MMRLALVGIGDAGAQHAKALAASSVARCVAIVARDPGRADTFLRAHSFQDPPKVFSSLDQLLNAGCCDGVVLATPDGLHAQQATEVLDAGLAVLVEKPFALSIPDAERVLSAARRRNQHVAAGYHLRHHPAHQAMLASSSLQDRVGALRSIHLRWAWPDPGTQGWRARGEDAQFWSLAALGTHCIDLALGTHHGDHANAASVHAAFFPPAGIDQAAELSFSLGDALVHISVSVRHRARSRFVITGEQGELEALGTLGARGEGELWYRPARGREEPIPFTPHSPYAAQLEAFVCNIPNGFQSDSRILTNVAMLEHIAASRKDLG